MFSKSRKFQIMFRLNNDRCPAVMFCTCPVETQYIVSHIVHKYTYISAWASRCCSNMIGQCESLQNVERAAELAPRFFYFMSYLMDLLLAGAKSEVCVSSMVKLS